MSTPATRYDAETFETALHELARNSGDASATHRNLQEQGIHVPRSTLQDWKQFHADRLAEIGDMQRKAIDDRLTQRWAEAMWQSQELQMLANQKAMERLEAGEDKDPGRTMQQAATSAGISSQNYRLFTGQPTANVARTDLDGVLDSIKRKLAIPSTAEEIPPNPAELEQ